MPYRQLVWHDWITNLTEMRLATKVNNRASQDCRFAFVTVHVFKNVVFFIITIQELISDHKA